MSKIDSFTIRVYGVLINKNNQVLLVHEKMPQLAFTKFPGGGLEFNEGTVDCLVREFKEEANIDIKVTKHLYTTDFFVQSAFNKNNQLLAIYYLVEPILNNFEIDLSEKVITVNGKTEILRFFWVDLNSLNEEMLTFPIDKFVTNTFLKK